MTCAMNVPVAVQPDFASISSTVTVSVKLPVIPWYAPVPEPVTTGACAVTVALPEQVAGLPRQWRNAVTNRLSRTASLSRNEPRVNSRRRSWRCSGSIRPSG